MAALISSPFSIPNIRLFIALRIFFNARFYYPVFTILFLDFGLSIEQFALLNTVWAATIVLAEVPSGALADIIGRKRLLVATSLLMITEMMLISLVPLGNMTIVFWAFLLNRVLSGLAEAMASGADEALAYDTLLEQGLAEEWPRVLDIQMRMQSAGFVVTMTVGALVYDPEMVNAALRWLGSSAEVSQQVSMRYPVYLTLVLALFALFTTLSMHEPVAGRASRAESETTGEILGRALRLTWQAGCWIVKTPFALAVILFGMAFDHVLRMIVTMTSQYYRLVALPEASFGLIGSAIGMLGLVVPKMARSMAQRFTPTQNVAILIMLSLGGLYGLTGFWPYFGLLPMVLIFVGLMLTSFLTSHYLNRITKSEMRATVLSFKGLSFNLAYGMIGVLYAVLMRNIRVEQNTAHPDWTEQVVANESFRESILWFPWYTGCILLLVLFYSWFQLRHTQEYRHNG